MAVTNYYSVGGMLIGEETAGVRTDYLTDALGSVTATVDQTGNVMNTYRYKPYGALLAKTGAAADPKFAWVGSEGYRQTGKKYSDVYVRARHYGTSQALWTSVDALWPEERPYVYVDAMGTTMTDKSGLACDAKLNVQFARIKNDATCVTSNRCGGSSKSCTFNFRWYLLISYTVKGCKNCKYYQWVSTDGGKSYKRDDCNASDGSVHWPYKTIGNADGSTTDAPGSQGGSPDGCPTITFKHTYIGCLCCQGGGICQTWTLSNSAPNCSNPPSIDPVYKDAGDKVSSMCGKPNKLPTNHPCGGTKVRVM